MLRYSYKTQLKKLMALKMGLELDLARNPNNDRAKVKLIELQNEIDWFKERIETGQDPGTIVI